MNSKINKAIGDLISHYQLNLEEHTVLTEIGTNEYAYLPEICLRSGAKKVIALVKDSSFSSASALIKEYKQSPFYKKFKDKILIVSDIKECSMFLNQVTLITNSGHLRPINQNILSLVSKNCIVALMYDIWEFRENDVCSEDCKRFQIPIVGTYEHHIDLRIFDYSGILALKMILNSGNSIKNQSILVWSDDDFGKTASEYIKKLNPRKCDLICEESIINNNEQYDIIFICDYDEERTYGESILVEFFKFNKEISVIHLFGKVSDKITNIYPNRNSSVKKMSKTFSYLGAMPVLELQVASLKATSSVYKNERCDYAQLFKF